MKHKTSRWRLIVISGVLLLLTSPLVYALYHHLYLNGVQAEARLMVGYMHTLQRVYRLDQGTFASFTYYGAPLQGRDYCEQPSGAAELGFMLHGCHDLKAPPPHYAYRIVEDSKDKAASYVIEAVSGSDAQGRSLVCFSAQSEEHLVSSQTGELKPMKSCW